MASSAFNSHLIDLLLDPENLLEVANLLPMATINRADQVEALHRSVIVMAVSAWEAYIEQLVREAVALLRPTASPFGLWPVQNAAILGQLGRFNTPNTNNVRLLISDALGLQNVQNSWTWHATSSLQAYQRLDQILDDRHKVAHGVHPRPIIVPFFAGNVPQFFRQLGRCTDSAVRNHLVSVLAIANPWPP